MRDHPGLLTTLFSIVLASCGCAFALDPSHDISQYAHTAWKVGNGLTSGKINAIAQTPDGYIWLGTDFGLFRFDGVRAVPWRPPAGHQLPSNNVSSLFASRDGTLWVGTLKGLVSWKNGRLTEYPDLKGFYIVKFLEDREGTIWMSGADSLNGKVCWLHSNTVTCWGESARLGSGAYGLYEDREGKVWLGAVSGLWQLRPGPPKLYPLTGETYGIEALGEDREGKLLVGWKGSIRQLHNEKIETYPLGATPEYTATYILRDRDGGLWIGTQTEGVLHAHNGRTEVFTLSDGLSGATVQNIFEDREGSIWVVTGSGLDRFRDFVVTTFTERQGLSKDVVGSVLADRDGTVWIATLGGLDTWRKGGIKPWGKYGKLNGLVPSSLLRDSRGRIWVSTKGDFGYLERDRFVPVASFPSGSVDDIAEDARGDLWIANQDEGLIHLSGNRVVEKIPWIRLGHKDNARTLIADSMRGGLWLGFYDGGIAHFADGKVQASYTAVEGLAKGRVDSFRIEQDGTLWVATDGGLSRLKGTRFATLGSKNGLPCDGVHWTVEDDDGSLWLYMQCALVRIARPDVESWAVALDKDDGKTIAFAAFDSSDGTPDFAAELWRDMPAVTKAVDGRIWFKAFEGASVVDPHHLPVNRVPPPVHIEQITANGRVYDTLLIGETHLQLPPIVRDLAIDYTALSFVAPEKVRFRYKLEGQDSGWREVVNDRHVQYSNLAPRRYTFRVMACNNSGVWNEEGASLDFVIPPAWYQTNWFRGVCVAAFLAMIWGMYQLRVQQLAAQFDMRLEERVSERTRIARDLHDTLLQSFQGLLLQFKAVSFRLQPGEIKNAQEAAIREASQAITEGRDTVQGLRATTVEKNDLAVAIRAVGEELASAEISQSPPAFQVFVERAPRSLHPILRDEVYRVAAEALRNSFRHAHAHQIEVELRYEEKHFTVRVRDDGKGIDRAVLSSGGPKGHFGLHGMRERARLAGGELAIWSEVDSGTEIELTIPASRAYTRPARGLSWLRKLSHKRTDVKEKVES